MLLESSINATVLVDAVREVLTKPDKAKAMKAAAQKQAVRDSAERIANIVEEQARKQGEPPAPKKT